MHGGVRLILYKGLYFRPKKYVQLNIELAQVWLDGKSLALSLGFAQFCRIVHHMILLLVLAFNKGSSTIDQSMLYARSNFSTRLLPNLGCHRPTAKFQVMWTCSDLFNYFLMFSTAVINLIFFSWFHRHVTQSVPLSTQSVHRNYFIVHIN